MNIFRLFESKKLMKICSKTHQIAPFKKNFWEIYLMINFLQAPKKVPPPLGKSCIRPYIWTTTEKFI